MLKHRNRRSTELSGPCVARACPKEKGLPHTQCVNVSVRFRARASSCATPRAIATIVGSAKTSTSALARRAPRFSLRGGRVLPAGVEDDMRACTFLHVAGPVYIRLHGFDSGRAISTVIILVPPPRTTGLLRLRKQDNTTRAVQRDTYRHVFRFRLRAHATCVSGPPPVTVCAHTVAGPFGFATSLHRKPYW